MYAEYGNYRALITPDGMKLVLGYGSAKLYNLNSDPGESNDLAPVRGMLVDRLKAELDARTTAARAAVVGAAPAALPLSPEQVQALKALGYVDDSPFGSGGLYRRCVDEQGPRGSSKLGFRGLGDVTLLLITRGLQAEIEPIELL